MKRGVPILVALVTLALFSCASEEAPSPTPTPEPQEVANGAAQAMQAVEAMHFVLEQEGTPVFVDADQSLMFRQAEGDYEAPDRLYALIKLAAGGIVADVRTIVVGKKQWMTNILSGQWEALPAGWGLDPTSFFDAEEGIPYVLAHGLVEPRLDGPHGVEGLEGEFWRLSGELAAGQAVSMSGGLISPGRARLSAWIDPSTLLVHRVRLELPETDPEDPTVWSIEFSDFGNPVDIQPP